MGIVQIPLHSCFLLFMTASNIQDEGAEIIADYLKTNSTLTSLNLSCSDRYLPPDDETIVIESQQITSSDGMGPKE